MAQEKQDILVAKLMADVSSFKKGMNEATEKANKSAGKLQKTFAKVGNAMKLGLAAGVAYLAYNAIGTVKDFEQGIANLAAVTGQSVDEIAGLKNEALRLGGATAYTANEVTKLQTELAKLGFREADIVDLTPAILNLAQATGTDLANAASLAGSVVQSFGLEAKDTVKVVDIMTKSFSESALDISKFEVGIRQVAPVAKTANVELSRVTAMLGVLANNGVRAETAGVGLRNILLEAAKRGKPFEELLSQINDSADKSKTAMELFGKENAAVGVILAESTSKVGELNDSLLLSAGTAQDMADKQLDTLQGRFTLLTSAWDGFILSIENGSGVIGHLFKSALEAATKVLNVFAGDIDSGIKPLTKLRAEFQTQIGVLNDVTLSEEARRKVVGKINEQYKDYLPKLISEKDSLEDLNTISKKVNDTITQKLILQAQEEKLSERIKAVVDAKSAVLENEIRLSEIQIEKITAQGAALAYLTQEEINLGGAMAYNAKVLGESEESLTDLFNIQEQVRQQLAVLSPTVETVTEDLNDNKNGLDDVADSADNANEKIKALGGSFYNLGTAINNSTAPIGNFTAGMDESMAKQQKQHELVNVLSQGFQQAFTEIGYAAVNGLGLAATGLQGFLGVMIQTATQAIGVALSQSLANGVLVSTNLAVSLGPAGIAALPVLIGGAIAAVKAGFSQVPALANGGIASGPTMALVGEYSGARSNPEVIAPLNKLQNMINGGSNNGGLQRLEAVIRGSDILLSNERATKQRTRFRGY